MKLHLLLLLLLLPHRHRATRECFKAHKVLGSIPSVNIFLLFDARGLWVKKEEVERRGGRGKKMKKNVLPATAPATGALSSSFCASSSCVAQGTAARRSSFGREARGGKRTKQREMEGTVSFPSASDLTATSCFFLSALAAACCRRGQNINQSTFMVVGRRTERRRRFAGVRWFAGMFFLFSPLGHLLEERGKKKCDSLSLLHLSFFSLLVFSFPRERHENSKKKTPHSLRSLSPSLGTPRC